MTLSRRALLAGVSAVAVAAAVPVVAVVLEGEVQSDLGGYLVPTDYSEALRGLLFDGGFLSIDEIRAREDLPPMGNWVGDQS